MKRHYSSHTHFPTSQRHLDGHTALYCLSLFFPWKSRRKRKLLSLLQGSELSVQFEAPPSFLGSSQERTGFIRVYP
jgi:hypothetical protein